MLYVESLLREVPPRADALYVGHRAAVDLLDYCWRLRESAVFWLLARVAATLAQRGFLRRLRRRCRSRISDMGSRRANLETCRPQRSQVYTSAASEALTASRGVWEEPWSVTRLLLTLGSGSVTRLPLPGGWSLERAR